MLQWNNCILAGVAQGQMEAPQTGKWGGVKSPKSPLDSQASEVKATEVARPNYAHPTWLGPMKPQQNMLELLFPSLSTCKDLLVLVHTHALYPSSYVVIANVQNWLATQYRLWPQDTVFRSSGISGAQAFVQTNACEEWASTDVQPFRAVFRSSGVSGAQAIIQTNACEGWP